MRTIPHAWLTAAILSVTLAAAQPAPPQPRQVAPYVPTTEAGVDAMLNLARVTSADVVYDLGCGDGRIVIAAARNFGARGVGIDFDPARIAEAKENARRAGVEKLVRFERRDFFATDIREATVVTLFLLPDVNLRLRPKLMRELKPGTRVVSNTFDMGDWKPDREAVVPGENSGLSHNLYLWIVPPRGRSSARKI